ncbi:MAG: hypothetical protein GF421_09625 [Candidatus Aminicenantes bacterium]|nr:hypothetical protein [Candidatus Aminicenantes bacterium]
MRKFFIALFTPLARRMETFNPNTLTFISFITGILTGLAFFLTRIQPWFFLVAGGLVSLSGAADSLDGIIARMYGRVTKKGDFLDHFSDRIVDIAIILGIAFSQGAHLILGFVLSLLILLHSYLGTQIEATLGKRSYQGTGKAEFFLGLILFSLLAAVFPYLGVEIAGNKIVIADMFMIILMIFALWGLVQRFLRGLIACMERDKEAGLGDQ